MNNNVSIYTYKDGFKDGIPIGLGYLSVSFGFGIAARLCGMKALEVLFTSMTNLTSAGQLAGISIIITSASIIEMILTQLIINLRYALMGISLSQKLDSCCITAARLLMSCFITDEIYAIASSKKGSVGPSYFYGIATAPYIGWSSGTLLGALCGDVLPKSVSAALGIAIYAMFIAIIVPPMRDDKKVALAVLISSALSCLICFTPALNRISSGFSIIICAVVSALVMAAFFPMKAEIAKEGQGDENAS